MRSSTMLPGVPLHTPTDLASILDAVGDARYVLIGEASHGTSEFYTWRAELSKRLIEEKGFSFIAVEGDWPDVYEVNRYVKGVSNVGDTAKSVLDRLARWPTWMWANWEVVAFIEWLRRFNEDRAGDQRVGFYGFDVYSLWESMERIIEYLRECAPEAVDQAIEAWQCFQPYGRDAQSYGWATLSLVPAHCEDEAVRLLRRVRSDVDTYPGDWEEHLNVEQNASIVVGAEEYYRTMVRGGPTSWNVRDVHMTETLERLMRYHGPDARAIVWAHNTHVGDARATDMASAGMVNVGQLVRQAHEPDDVHAVGLGTYSGSVIASRGWGERTEAMILPAAPSNSWEGLLHGMLSGDRVFDLRDWRRDPTLMTQRGHRAVGVVYHPEREHLGNFVPTVLPQRYDSFIYVDHSVALYPLHTEPPLDAEPPETYPWGF